MHWINNIGTKETRPKHNQICKTKSILDGNEKICIWNKNINAFNPIIDGVIQKNISLKDSAKYWKIIE